MCGVAGLVCLDANCRRDHAAMVTAMCDTQTHRGPDDQGVEVLGPVCLGSRRLSILDITPAGHMPMADTTGRWWITYNGEVYNFRELRAELEPRGHVFTSGTDTEVILHAFIEWGEEAFNRFVGMFAIAILDRQTGTLTLVRDRYGVKPLYHATADGHFLFSSEIKAIRLLRDRARVDRQRLAEWFLYRNADALAPETLLEDIVSVLPGQMVTVRNGTVTARAYYTRLAHVQQDAYEESSRCTPAEHVERVDGLLNEAVRCRLVSDVPVGTLCSGGLDSSLVTAMAARHTTALTAFNVSVHDAPSMDERQFAERLTSSLGIPLVCHTLTAESFRASLPEATYYSDTPLTHPNSVAYLQISRVAREHGVIVLLSGEGADELFGGYGWAYRRLRTLLRLESLLHLLPQHLQSQLTLVVYAAAGLPATAHRFREVLPTAVAAIDRFVRMEWQERCESAYDFVARPRERAVLGRMLGDLSDFLAPLLRRLDRMTMAASVESRVPFLDHRLVHTAINLPLQYRIGARADKWLLKQVARRYLPRRDIWRRKMGFPIPLGTYIAPFADDRFFRDGFCHEVLGLRWSGLSHYIARWDRDPYAFFGLLTLEMWGRMYVMGQALEEVEQHFAVPRGVTTGSAPPRRGGALSGLRAASF
ncbi:MAG TPA: asparagine synthase (glutamine-hydrolyzing) [Gemmatimonadaceae bacterium]|nr:asparagine synthase (glutamine-hydrolyzing) [Gemmatimonadaceae bacterium]